ncbi:hypothetical protein XI09_01940 [Bradyrhizobium sp. CCBAU 11386]|uniref:NrtR DNA-binding winged helix domain-containing protein n=1 Tax=Bradyrhizobium sp. CCBAU 11386 TaxID=1630837 RepID=UPI003FA41AF5|nr:hypothetical protein [Bradyrhizobium sp. CCBAU 11386]
MPAEFTLPDLQRVHEIALDRPLEKSAFRTRILSADMIEPVARMRRGPNRPAQLHRLQLYRLKKDSEPVYSCGRSIRRNDISRRGAEPPLREHDCCPEADAPA